jgi:hypothetical protein
MIGQLNEWPYSLAVFSMADDGAIPVFLHESNYLTKLTICRSVNQSIGEPFIMELLSLYTR